VVWRWYTIPAPDEVQPDGTRGRQGNFAKLRNEAAARHIAAEKPGLDQYADARHRAPVA
jgi:hypothetical protein